MQVISHGWESTPQAFLISVLQKWQRTWYLPLYLPPHAVEVSLATKWTQTPRLWSLNSLSLYDYSLNTDIGLPRNQYTDIGDLVALQSALRQRGALWWDLFCRSQFYLECVLVVHFWASSLRNLCILSGLAGILLLSRERSISSF
jgi:hypothetical protein